MTRTKKKPTVKVPKHSKKPVKKVAAAGAGGAASVILIAVAAQFGLDLPEPVATAIGVLFSFAAGYLKSA